MKKIILKISVLALIIGGFASCDKELDQVPFDEFGTENAYVTAQDFENAIRGVYSGLTSAALYGGSDAGGMLDAPDVLADNVTQSQGGRFTRTTLHNWNYGPADGPMAGLYSAAYGVIYRANLILTNIDDFGGDTKDNIIGEAKAVRALAHLNAVTFFGKIPTQSSDANGSLGVPIVTEPDPNILPERASVSAVYDFISSELKEAAQLINVSNPVGRLNRDGVNTLLSRVYLYMGEWQKAVDAANLVSKPVAPRESVVDVWVDDSQDGLLFYIPNETGVIDASVGVTWSQGGVNALKPEYVVSYDLYNLYSDDDIRKDAFTFNGSGNGIPYNGIKKLFGRTGQSNGKVDIKILRAAEAHLNKAEALFNLGRETDARAALDVVRTKRYTNPPSGETGNALRDAIRLERRLEFAFESQRFFDLKRWGLGVSRDGHGDHADGGGTASESQNLSNSSPKLQLPLYQGAMDRNPNLQQNPGY